MTEEDRTYFERRAEVELKLAKQSLDPAVMRAHYAFDRQYLDTAHGTKRRNASA